MWVRTVLLADRRRARAIARQALAFYLQLPAYHRAWAAAGRAPLLSLSPSRLSAGRASLARIGLPADAWFVAMHVRDPAFHGEAQGRSRADLAARDADVMTYLPAIERIVARYRALRVDTESFIETYRRVGLAPFKDAVYGTAGTEERRREVA